ncbi:winged helix DNA-binding protein [Sphingomonas jatrophae]|nr:winged helix DNA-binding protein [Sphingomonas jatrophae]
MPRNARPGGFAQASDADRRSDGADGAARPTLSRMQAVEVARAVYDARRQRDRLFGEGLFADPAWDILLDTFVRTSAGRVQSVSAACIGAAAPATTALRHIALLEQAGLLERTRDPGDGRRVFLGLSEHGSRQMIRWLSMLGSDVLA